MTRKCEKELMDDIRTRIIEGEINSWCRMKITETLLGFETSEEFDRKIYKHLLQKCTTHINIHDFLISTIGRDSNGECDFHFNDPDLVFTAIDIHDRTIADSDKTFDVVDFFKWMDIRNPIILLRYFLKENSNMFCFNNNQRGYKNLLKMIIHRTNIRKEKIREYGNFVEKLETKYREFINTVIMRS